MSYVKDCIHGMISISPLEQQIIDTPDFQRLRRIKQLACAYLVYPGAMHTRFEHSLGAMHLAGMFAGSMELNAEETRKLRLAALLHDIGHVAFSHEAEAVLEKHIGDHEKIGLGKLRRGKIADIISENYSTSDIVSIFKGEKIGQAITSDIGCDRMDYLLRDSYHTGVAYGIVDTDRIISRVKFSGNLVIKEGGLEATESLLIARFLMFSTLYYHHTVRVAAAMLRKSISMAIEKSGFDPKSALALGDSEMLSALMKTDGASFALGLQDRRLYKVAYSIPVQDAGSRVVQQAKSGELEKELMKECGCNLLVDAPSAFYKPATIKVETQDGQLPLEKVSMLVRSLEKSEASRLKLMVCAPESEREKVAKCAKSILG